MTKVFFIGGVPDSNMTLFHRVRFATGDPAAVVLWLDDLEIVTKSVFIVRDIEVDRARQSLLKWEVYAPKDLCPTSELSADRDIATAQAAAALIGSESITKIWIDRSTPAIYQHVLQTAGLTVHCDPNLVQDARRQKTTDELAALRDAQRITELVMRQACEMIAGATIGDDGVLISGNAALTSERIQRLIDVWLIEHDCVDSTSIVAGGPQAADCHHRGQGFLRTGEPIIVDIFPRSKTSRYFGDCTRTVVHGDAPESIRMMHQTVVAAKQAAVDVTRNGVTGDSINAATLAVIKSAGYGSGPFNASDSDEVIKMVHGTGHGVGLSLHEAPLLVDGGPAMLVNDVVTIEPGLYSRLLGGVRVEDMYIVKADHCERINTLHEGLEWN